MPGLPSSKEHAPRDGDKGSYACCTGLAFFNKAMQEQGKVPTCLGLRHVKEGHLKADQGQALPPDTDDYQFYCLGYSAHPSSGPSNNTMPYCEGVELINFAQSAAEAAAQQPSAAPAAELEVEGADAKAPAVHLPPAGLRAPVHHATIERAVASQPQSPEQAHPSGGLPVTAPTFTDRFLEKCGKNLASMQATLRNEGTVKMHAFKSAEELRGRLWDTGCQNVGKLHSALGRASSLISDKAGAAWQAVSSSLSSSVSSRERAGES